MTIIKNYIKILIQKASKGKCNKDIQKVNRTSRKVSQFGSQKHS